MVRDKLVWILDFDIPRYEKFHSEFLIHTTYHQVFLEKQRILPIILHPLTSVFFHRSTLCLDYLGFPFPTNDL